MVFSVIVVSVTKRFKYSGPPALGPVHESPKPPKGWVSTTAPILLRLI